jgi:hypothetical protein
VRSDGRHDHAERRDDRSRAALLAAAPPRWFTQYDPLYLASALLVLVGLTLVARSSGTPTLEGELDVGAIVAELYAFALIGGAWLLMRVGLCRPAVLLGLLAVLYQADPSLLTERSAYLGLGGEVAVVVWLGVFVTKLVALASALRLRLSPSALAVPAFGALAIALLPRLLDGGEASRNGVVAVITFAVLAAGLWTRREVTSTEPLDAWDEKVLRRSTRATWALWAALFVGHVAFSSVEHHVSAVALLPAALMGSATLVLRAVRLPSLARLPAAALPCRVDEAEPAPWIW